MGCLNNIITNSQYYYYVFWFSTLSAVLAVVLNLYLIRWYGIIGAAYATLFVIVFINLLKIILVQYRFKINPYGRETLPTISIVVLLYFLISSISIDYDPFTVMIFRSTFIGITFILLAYLLKLTDDIQQFLAKIFPFVKRD